MLYLLDANVLIEAHNKYYPIEQIQEYWDWLIHLGHSGQIKIPIEIIEEIKKGHKDSLFFWIENQDHQNDLCLKENVDIGLLQWVIKQGYADDLTEEELGCIGKDPFLIAYGMVKNDRCIVTTEVSKPSKKRHHKKIPDVCASLKVRCCNTFAMNRELKFCTNWKNV